MTDLAAMTPAHDAEAERAVLGAILLDPEVVDLVAVEIKPADFYRTRHRLVFDAMLALNSARKPIDKLSVVKALLARGVLDEAGGPVEIDSLTSVVPTSANAIYYAELVAEKARVRATQSVLAASLRRLHERIERTDTDEVLDQIEAGVFEATRSRANTAAPTTIGDALRETFEKIDRTMSGVKWGVPTGLAEIDAMANGLPKGEITIVAARPSIGKSCLSQCIARNVCYGDRSRSADRKVLFFSLEMTRTQVVENLLGSIARVNTFKIRTGMLTHADRDSLHDAGEFLSAGRFEIVDSPRLSVLDVRARARRAAREGGLDLVVVDYVQLMDAPESGYGTPRHEQIANVSRGLKALAHELEIPVLAVCQLNRKVEDRGASSKPKLSDLKDSGALEQDAALVLLLHRQERDDDGGKPPENTAGVIVAKNRYGPTGEFELYYDRTTANFADMEAQPPSRVLMTTRDGAALAAGEER